MKGSKYSKGSAGRTGFSIRLIRLLCGKLLCARPISHSYDYSL